MKGIYSVRVSADMVSLWTSCLEDVIEYGERNGIPAVLEGNVYRVHQGRITVNCFAEDEYKPRRHENSAAKSVPAVNAVKNMLKAAGFEIISVEYSAYPSNCDILLNSPEIKTFISWCIKHHGVNVSRKISENGYLHLYYRVHGVTVSTCYLNH